MGNNPEFSFNNLVDETITPSFSRKLKKELNSRDKNLKRNKMISTQEEKKLVLSGAFDPEATDGYATLSEDFVQSLLQDFETYLRTEKIP